MGWKPTLYTPLTAQANHVQTSMFAIEPRTEPPEGEPHPSSWKRCVCGHDIYIHTLAGYEIDGLACLYGEGCTCTRFRKCSHPLREVQNRLDGGADSVCMTCGDRA